MNTLNSDPMENPGFHDVMSRSLFPVSKKAFSICKIFLLLFSLFLNLTAFSMAGEIWRWTDKNNLVHFTDNRLSIPPNHRATARGVNFSDTKTLKGGVAFDNPPPATVKKREKTADFSVIRGELASHIKYEIERDSQIIIWVNNSIAIKKMKEIFTKDLETKSRILEKVAMEENGDLQNELEWLTENISRENRILRSVRDPNPGTIYLFSGIKESIKKNIADKKDFLLTLQM